LATDGLLKQLEGYLQTVHNNVCSISGEGKSRFERACTVAVAIELEPIFDRLVRSRGQEFIDSIDEWLERNAKHESASGTYVELGAGAYFVDLGTRLVLDSQE
jgi:ribose 1,5-bisphosphokinase PhnN